MVAFQLPDHIEAVATFWGVSLLGAPIVPIVHFYGPKGGRLHPAGVANPGLVTADRFGHLGYLEMIQVLQPDLPTSSTCSSWATTPARGNASRTS